MSIKKKQLFLLHFAGGNKYSYNFLQKSVVSNIEFVPMELPGRGERFRETLITDKKEAIYDLFEQINRKRNGAPFIIFGHSMGAILGLSITKLFEENNDGPDYLIVSGNPGPLDDYIVPNRYNLDDNQFKSKIAELGGIPKEVIEDKEAFDFFSKIMRADFECIEKDQDFEKNTSIKTPIYAIMGDQESLSVRIENWGKFTKTSFEYSILEGNHFFIHQHSNRIGEIINYCFV
ncbi:thioesterase II family protein [Chryseobacterium sp. LAM-KRS1]|uniref:thioesterase II family protein n=1 Tax=Chryseobacterium sp. LAM-KRS1 TaxID=2715754 RepID=UPI001557B331|nr:thioesterase [Chryseobacterium sp. LAM-KRS1]